MTVTPVTMTADNVHRLIAEVAAEPNYETARHTILSFLARHEIVWWQLPDEVTDTLSDLLAEK
jgi:hypothetical protein